MIILTPRPLDAERAAHARRRHDGVCGVRAGVGGEDYEGVEGLSKNRCVYQ
jgi:hypothetical protein